MPRASSSLLPVPETLATSNALIMPYTVPSNPRSGDTDEITDNPCETSLHLLTLRGPGRPRLLSRRRFPFAQVHDASSEDLANGLLLSSQYSTAPRSSDALFCSVLIKPPMKSGGTIFTRRRLTRRSIVIPNPTSSKYPAESSRCRP